MVFVRLFDARWKELRALFDLSSCSLLFREILFIDTFIDTDGSVTNCSRIELLNLMRSVKGGRWSLINEDAFEYAEKFHVWSRKSDYFEYKLRVPKTYCLPREPYNNVLFPSDGHVLFMPAIHGGRTPKDLLPSTFGLSPISIYRVSFAREKSD